MQLPQTISVEDDQSYRMASTDSTIAAFPEGFFTFFGRSADSVQYAKQHYPQSTSLPAPDLAWSLGPMMPSAAKVDVLIVMRGDWEAADGERYVDKLLNASQTASDSGSSQGRIAALLRQLTEKNLTYAVRDWDFTPEHGFNAFHETSSVGEHTHKQPVSACIHKLCAVLPCMCVCASHTSQRLPAAMPSTRLAFLCVLTCR